MTTTDDASVADAVIGKKIAAVTSEDHILAVVEELGRRAVRRSMEIKRGGSLDRKLWKSGNVSGYIQAISLLLDISYTDVQMLMENGWLGDGW